MRSFPAIILTASALLITSCGSSVSETEAEPLSQLNSDSEIYVVEADNVSEEDRTAVETEGSYQIYYAEDGTIETYSDAGENISDTQESFESRALSAANAAGCSVASIVWDNETNDSASSEDSLLLSLDMAMDQPDNVEWLATQECMYLLQNEVYGNQDATVDALGGADQAEKITDFMAILSGVNPPHGSKVFPGNNSEWETARELLNGQRP